MIDRIYLWIGLGLATLVWPGIERMAWFYGAAIVAVALLLVCVIAPLRLREWLALRFGGPRRAPFLVLRGVQGKTTEAARRQRHAAARRLIDTYALALDAGGPGPAEALRALVADALAADAAVPGTVATPLRMDLMGRALAEVSGQPPPAHRALGVQLSGLIPMNRPVPPRRLAWGALRRILSPLVMPASVRRDLTQHVAAYLPQMLARGSDPLHDSRTTPTTVLASFLLTAREQAGLPVLPDQGEGLVTDLPLSDQITLRLLSALLAGTPPARLILRHPSRHRQIRLLEKAARQARAGQGNAAPTTGDAPLAPEDPPHLLAEHAQTAILLRRVWPLAPSGARSHLGGLPALPEGVDWPRRRSGQPLHFLATIDCAEMPPVADQPALPGDGTLLFFADISEKMLFAQDSIAVLYVPADQPTAPRAVPDDLPPLRHGIDPLPGPRGYDRWPVTPRLVQTWDLSPGARGPIHSAAYRSAAQAAQDDSLAAHIHRHRHGTGARVALTDRQTDKEGACVTALHPKLTASGWPWCGALVARLFADLRLAADRQLATPGQSQHHHAARKLQTNLARAAPRFAALGPHDPVPPDIAQALHRWITGGLRAGLVGTLEDAIRSASLATLRASLHDSALRRVLPASAMHLFAADLQQSIFHGRHLMLGALRHKTGETGPGDADLVRLMCLDTDPGQGFRFCDGGGIEYWIPRVALAARDFSRVTAAA